MKKNRINAFTLVEMLIVIVIIGILIAALMPRMQSAQGRSRDVARKNDLAQLQTSIVTSQQDKGNWPGMSETYCSTDDIESTNANGKCTNSKWVDDVANDGISVEDISESLLVAGMSAIPKDPLADTEVSGLGNGNEQSVITTGSYAYMVSTRNGTENGGFILMAKTEIEGGSNWVVCQDVNNGSLLGGFIDDGTDLKNIIPCTTMEKGATCEVTGGVCKYKYDGELRYIVVY